MLSSLVFHHTLRDSRFLLEGLEYSKDKNVFMSADESALRLWSNTRQIKSSHLNGGFELLALEHLHYFDCFLLVYYLRDTKVGYAELWDSELKKIQKMKLGSMNSKSRCVFSPDKSFFIMTDNEENMHVYDINAAQKIKPKKGPWFPRSSDFNKVSNKTPPNIPGSGLHRPQLQIRKVQTLSQSALGYANLQVLHIFNENCFAFIASRVLYVLKRLKGKEPFTVDVEEIEKVCDDPSMDFSSIQTMEDNKEADGDEEENKEEEDEEEVMEEGENVLVTPQQFFEDYYFTLSLQFETRFQAHGIPVAIRTMGATSNFLCTTFTNGYIGIYECGDMFSSKCYRPSQDKADYHDSFDGDDLDGEPEPVAFFKAHSPLSSSPFLSTQVQACPWQTVPGNVYALEVFSLGSDYKLCHWGLRRRLRNPSLSTEDLNSPPPPSAASLLRPTRNLKKCTYEVDLLGVSVATWLGDLNHCPLSSRIEFVYPNLWKRECVCWKEEVILYTTDSAFCL